MVTVAIAYPFLWLWIVLAAVIGAAVTFALVKILGGKSDSKPSDKKVIAEGIEANASDFAELYEPTYALCCGKTSKKEAVLDSWNEKVSAGDYTKEFKDAFAAKFGDTKKLKGKDKKYVKQADKLVECIFDAGVVRSNDTEVKANETTAEKYDTAGNVSLETDGTYEVLAPYWYKNDRIFVKGVLR